MTLSQGARGGTPDSKGQREVWPASKNGQTAGVLGRAGVSCGESGTSQGMDGNWSECFGCTPRCIVGGEAGSTISPKRPSSILALARDYK